MVRALKFGFLDNKRNLSVYMIDNRESVCFKDNSDGLKRVISQ